MSDLCKLYDVVGVTFDGRQSILSGFYKRYRVGGKYGVDFVKEDSNPYDANAVAVMLETSPGNYEKVGYLSSKNKDNVHFRKHVFKHGDLRSIGPGQTGNIGLTVCAVFDGEEAENG